MSRTTEGQLKIRKKNYLENFASIYEEISGQQYRDFISTCITPSRLLIDRNCYLFGKLPTNFDYPSNEVGNAQVLTDNELNYLVTRHGWNGIFIEYEDVYDAPILACEAQWKRMITSFYLQEVNIRVSLGRSYNSGVFFPRVLIIFERADQMFQVYSDIAQYDRLFRLWYLRPVVKLIPYRFDINHLSHMFLAPKYETQVKCCMQLEGSFTAFRRAQAMFHGNRHSELGKETYANPQLEVFFLRGCFTENLSADCVEGAAFGHCVVSEQMTYAYNCGISEPFRIANAYLLSSVATIRLITQQNVTRMLQSGDQHYYDDRQRVRLTTRQFIDWQKTINNEVARCCPANINEPGDQILVLERRPYTTPGQIPDTDNEYKYLRKTTDGNIITRMRQLDPGLKAPCQKGLYSQRQQQKWALTNLGTKMEPDYRVAELGGRVPLSDYETLTDYQLSQLEEVELPLHMVSRGYRQTPETDEWNQWGQNSEVQPTAQETQRRDVELPPGVIQKPQPRKPLTARQQLVLSAVTAEEERKEGRNQSLGAWEQGTSSQVTLRPPPQPQTYKKTKSPGVTPSTYLKSKITSTPENQNLKIGITPQSVQGTPITISSDFSTINKVDEATGKSYQVLTDNPDRPIKTEEQNLSQPPKRSISPEIVDLTNEVQNLSIDLRDRLDHIDTKSMSIQELVDGMADNQRTLIRNVINLSERLEELMISKRRKTTSPDTPQSPVRNPQPELMRKETRTDPQQQSEDNQDMEHDKADTEAAKSTAGWSNIDKDSMLG